MHHVRSFALSSSSATTIVPVPSLPHIPGRAISHPTQVLYHSGFYWPDCQKTLLLCRFVFFSAPQICHSYWFLSLSISFSAIQKPMINKQLIKLTFFLPYSLFLETDPHALQTQNYIKIFKKQLLLLFSIYWLFLVPVT